MCSFVYNKTMFRKLTRVKQEISREECVKVLKEAPRGVLSVLGDNGYPYGMPMNFLFDEASGHIYFHGGRKGHKIDALKRDNKVSFCVYDEGFRRKGEWALNIKSVIIFGRISFIDDPDRIVEISRALSYKYTSDSEYIENEIKHFSAGTLCMELIPENICGKVVNES